MSGKYFEDFEVGEKIATPGRTIGESEISLFAGLSGDYNPIHCNTEYCKNTHFGKPIAHGLLVLSILSGLIERTGIHEDTIIAVRRMTEIEFNRPVFAGDTLTGTLTVLEKMNHTKGGLVQLQLLGLNQRNEAVLKMNYEVLMRRKEDGKF